MKKTILVLITIFISSISGFAQNDSSAVHQTQVTNEKDTTEIMPEYPGGLSALGVYLSSSIRYPQIEKDAGKEGIVYVQFVIEKDGSISNILVVKEVPGAPGLSKEAIRVISEMPNWKPGMKGGKPVRVAVTQPIRFVLGEKASKKKKHK